MHKYRITFFSFALLLKLFFIIHFTFQCSPLNSVKSFIKCEGILTIRLVKNTRGADILKRPVFRKKK